MILIKDTPLERRENEQSDWPIVQTPFRLFEVEGDMHRVVTKVFVRKQNNIFFNACSICLMSVTCTACQLEGNYGQKEHIYQSKNKPDEYMRLYSGIYAHIITHKTRE